MVCQSQIISILLTLALGPTVPPEAQDHLSIFQASRTGPLTQSRLERLALLETVTPLRLLPLFLFNFPLQLLAEEISLRATELLPR